MKYVGYLNYPKVNVGFNTITAERLRLRSLSVIACSADCSTGKILLEDVKKSNKNLSYRAFPFTSSSKGWGHVPLGSMGIMFIKVITSLSGVHTNIKSNILIINKCFISNFCLIIVMLYRYMFEIMIYILVIGLFIVILFAEKEVISCIIFYIILIEGGLFCWQNRIWLMILL